MTFITFLIMAGFVLSEQNQTPQANGVFKNVLQVGEGPIAGFVKYDESNQTYTLRGSGYGVGETEDSFQSLWNSVQGDFIMRAEIHHSNNTEDINSDVVYGWSVRNTISPDSEMLTFSVTHDNGAKFSARSSKGGVSSFEKISGSSPDVIHLERVNGLFTIRLAQFGEPLKIIEIPEVNLRNEVLAGLFVHSSDSEKVADVSFRNVRIVKPFPENEQRYQRYLGSRMEVLEVHTGMREVLFESEHSVQAPNWTVDGKKLIYNSNGYLYNYQLSDGQITYLNTGFATNNNNDHVITFDGKQIAISHHVPYDNNQSTIFIMPIEGGDPAIVAYLYGGQGTINVPSWSPDSRYVAFVSNSGRFY